MFHASPLHPSSPTDYSRVQRRLSQTSFLSLSTVYIDLNIRPYRNASFVETAKKSKKEIIPADVVNACTILYLRYPIEELSGPKDFADFGWATHLTRSSPWPPPHRFWHQCQWWWSYTSLSWLQFSKMILNITLQQLHMSHVNFAEHYFDVVCSFRPANGSFLYAWRNKSLAPRRDHFCVESTVTTGCIWHTLAVFRGFWDLGLRINCIDIRFLAGVW